MGCHLNSQNPRPSTTLSRVEPPNEQRGLTPLFWSNINPYGKFTLDMDTRLDIDARQPTESIV
jgi:hypothetical protein